MPNRSTQSNSSVDGVSLHLDLLGGFSIRLDSREVPQAAFARRKACSLLKLMALQPGYRLHRYQANDRLWPDLPPRRSAAQLYKAVHHVRQAFATVNLALPLSTLRDVSTSYMKEA